MALRLEDKWIWDSWYAFDGERYHAFYLHASRALGDPVRRHRHPIIGHAVSDDLTNWTVVRDALIVFFALQRYFVRGLTAGAVK